MSDWRTGVYLTTGEVEQDPEYSVRLRDEIGLTTVVLSFSGTLPYDGIIWQGTDELTNSRSASTGGS
jgi:hypothetical protein